VIAILFAALGGGVEYPDTDTSEIDKVEEIAQGRVRIQKVEAVDPRGAMSPLMNNYVISLVFFRNYMFEQAKALRDTLVLASG